MFICSTEEVLAADAPVISSTPLTITEEGADYSYDVELSDSTKDNLTFSLVKSAPGMTINQHTGLINWTPTRTQAGSYEIEVEVKDNQRKTATQSFVLDVAEGINNDPEIISEPVLEGEEGQEYSYDLKAKDKDQQQIIFKLVEGPQGMTIDQAKGVIDWKPTSSQSGNYDVKVKALDGRGGSDTQSYSLTVKEAVNKAPVITSEPITSGSEGEEYSYDVEASDINNDRLEYSLVEAPLGMKIDTITGLITWLPKGTQAGEYDIKVKVADGKGGIVRQEFELKIAEAINTAPQIISTPDTNGKEGEEFSYNVEAKEEDGDPLSYSLVTKARGMKIDSSTGRITWTPDSNQGGDHKIEVKVTDGRGGADKQNFMLTIADTLNTDPEILSTPVTSVKEGEEYRYRLKLRDKDGDDLKLEFSLPTGMKPEKVDGDIQLVWTPTAQQAGEYNISIKADDNRGGTTEQNYMLTVAEAVNAAPVITSKVPGTGIAGQLYSYNVEAIDAEEDTLTYSLVNAPGGMDIEETTGYINWIPKSGHVGEHHFKIKVTDDRGGLTVQEAVVQIAAASNKAPQITSTPKEVAKIGIEYSYDVEATDSDGDPLTYSLTTKPAGMTIDASSGIINWTPEEIQQGANEVVVVVSDNSGAEAKQEFSITVSESTFDLPLSTKYLNNQDLFDEEVLDFKTLALLIKVYSNSGTDMPHLKDKLTAYVADQKLIEQAYSLMAVSDDSLAESVVTKQKPNGSWEDSIYQTAISSYGLLEADLKVSSALQGLDYLAAQQNSNGSWNHSIQDTAVAVLALVRGGYHNSAVQEAVKWLLLQQSGSGNWGSNTNTSWTMLALLEEGNYKEEVKEAATYLAQLINKNGSWGIYPGQKGNDFTSALVLLALQKYDPTIKEIEDAFTYVDKIVGDKLYINQAFRYYNLAEINYLLKDYSDFNAGNISWLTDFADQKNYDYLARRISIGAQAGEDVSDLVNQLLAGQQRDGGWGFKDGYESNTWDTTLAIRALLDTGYDNLTVYARAGGYLQQKQKADGSFSLQTDEEGSIYLTTMVVEELDRLSDRLNVSSSIESSRSWLINQRSSSGGYGTSTLETARALSVIYEQLSPSEIDATLEELKNTRLANGSWDNDALTTAAVIEAILKVK